MDMLREFMMGKWGTYAIMAGIFFLIAWFLRFLYGPKGIFRDPYWDKRNKEIREEEERKKRK